MIKRYLVFAGATYYPEGGMEDCLGQFDSVKECLTELKTKGTELDEYGLCNDNSDHDWAYVYDLETQTVVKGSTVEDKEKVYITVHYLKTYGLEHYRRTYGEPTEQILRKLAATHPYHPAVVERLNNEE